MARTYQTLAEAGDKQAQQLDTGQIADAHVRMASALAQKQWYLDRAAEEQAKHDAIAATIGE